MQEREIRCLLCVCACMCVQGYGLVPHVTVMHGHTVKFQDWCCSASIVSCINQLQLVSVSSYLTTSD